MFAICQYIKCLSISELTVFYFLCTYYKYLVLTPYPIYNFQSALFSSTYASI
ncbi:hypothetical protein FQS96_13680 [Enterococcus faecalis]|nr:hypothetical protein [Enterococcus faecalis]